MLYYRSIKVMIDISDLVEVIINIFVRHYGFPELIVTDQNSLFKSKFWSLLYYFVRIKKKLSTAFQPLIDD